MNKSTIEAGQPEHLTVNEQEADIIPSAQVSANAVLSAALSVDEILSGNRLIAEFMCWDRTEPTNSTLFEQSIKHTQYHRSWDWLMPVVEKINKTLEPLTVSLTVTTAGVFLTKIHNAICEVDIKLAHSEIVSAIKWYNDNAVSVGSR